MIGILSGLLERHASPVRHRLPQLEPDEPIGYRDDHKYPRASDLVETASSVNSKARKLWRNANAQYEDQG